jgi:hypothetical protein
VPEVTVTLDDGETIPLARVASCHWVMYRACGCPFGCLYAVFEDEVLLDEDAALLAFYDRDEGDRQAVEARVGKARADGVTARLVSEARFRGEVLPALLGSCIHGPGAQLPLPR